MASSSVPSFGFEAASELVHRYADIVTRRAWSELDQVVTADVSVTLDLRDREPIALRGRDALGDFLDRAMARFAWFQFVPLAIAAAPGRPGHGRSRLYIEERRHLVGSSGTPRTVANGVYHDEVFFGPDGWRWSRRHYSSLARSEPWELFDFPADFTHFLNDSDSQQ